MTKKTGSTQNKVYEFIKSYIAENSIPPTIREIGEGIGKKSTSTIFMHLNNLKSKGIVDFTPSKQRSITLNSPEKELPDVQVVPFVGTVAAGIPIEAFEDIQDPYFMPRRILHGATENDVFMLKIDGESMIEAGMLPGDKIIVNRELAISNGDIVVAKTFGESATVKRYFHEGSRIRLQPDNSAMEPIYIGLMDVEILGKVIGLIREF